MVGDDEDELELRAFRDALRDIFASDGRVEIAFEDSAPGEANATGSAELN